MWNCLGGSVAQVDQTYPLLIVEDSLSQFIMQGSDLNIFLYSSCNLSVADFSFEFIACLMKSISLNFLFRMVKGVVSFIRTPRSLLIFSPKFLQIKMVIFAQVMILCGSHYYISLFVRNIKDTRVTGTANIQEKEVQDQRSVEICPLFCLERSVQIP